MIGDRIMLWKDLRRFRRDRRGASSAEFALVVPLFVLVTFGTISTAIGLSAMVQMQYAAERAARCLSVNVAGSCSDINAYAKGYYKGPSMTGLTFTKSAPACGNKVTGTGSYQLVTGFKSTAISMSTSACYPVI
jgi:Flp pilus assembly protein TadG